MNIECSDLGLKQMKNKKFWFIALFLVLFWGAQIFYVVRSYHPSDYGMIGIYIWIFLNFIFLVIGGFILMISSEIAARIRARREKNNKGG